MGYSVRVLGNISGYTRYVYLRRYSKHGCVLGDVSDVKEYERSANAIRAAEGLFDSQLSQCNFDYLKIEVINSLTNEVLLELNNPERQAEIQENRIQMTDNEAALQACKAGVLPHRQRVKVVWGIVYLVLVSFLLTTGLILMMWQDYADSTGLVIILFFLIVTVGFSIAILGRSLGLLSNPKIEFIEGQVLKSRERIGEWGVIEQFRLTCNGHQFVTDSTIWYEISGEKSYRLWYSPISKKVVAFESPKRK